MKHKKLIINALRKVKNHPKLDRGICIALGYLGIDENITPEEHDFTEEYLKNNLPEKKYGGFMDIGNLFSFPLRDTELRKQWIDQQIKKLEK